MPTWWFSTVIYLIYALILKNVHFKNYIISADSNFIHDFVLNYTSYSIAVLMFVFLCGIVIYFNFLYENNIVHLFVLSSFVISLILSLLLFKLYFVVLYIIFYFIFSQCFWSILLFPQLDILSCFIWSNVLYLSV